MKELNSLTICKEDYESKEEFANAIRDAVMVLLNNNYIMVVKYDEKGLGIVSITYEYANEEYGCRYPRWLLPEEEETVVWKEQ